MLSLTKRIWPRFLVGRVQLRKCEFALLNSGASPVEVKVRDVLKH